MTRDRVRITQASYDVIAPAFLAATRDPRRGRAWLDRFAEALPSGARVADLGSGPGRDTAELLARGLRAFSLDRSIGMLRAGVAEFPAVRVQADLLALPLGTASVAGAWANASLLHLAEAEAALALREIHRVLQPGGSLHVSLKRGSGARWESERYGEPRFFQFWSGADLDAALTAAEFEIRVSALERQPSTDWLVRQCVRV
jgi:SAM-dependent methyltransferase